METTEPVLTSETHDECGEKMYRVGSGRKLFCSTCRTNVTDAREASSAGGADDVE